MNKIKVIIKRPDEKYGHMTWISDTLENLQKTVGGYIETIPVGSEAVIICNEEGKLMGLERNFKYGHTFPDVICGTVIVCGTNGEEFTDIPFDMGAWKLTLDLWGN